MRQVVSGVLAEQTCDVASRGDQAVIDGRWDEHFDDWLAAPSVQSCLAISAVHVAETWSKDDAGRVVIIRHAPWQG